MRDVTMLTRSLAVPAVRLVTRAPSGLSHFGGHPRLPAEHGWPTKNGRKLAFLARISMPELHRAHPVPWLPQAGALLFFYDVRRQPWGSNARDRGGWAVMHVPDAVPQIQPTHVPADEDSIGFHVMGLERIDSLPSWGRSVIVGLKFSEEEENAYIDVHLAPFQDGPRHQVSGFPTPVQGDDMEVQCAFASLGIPRGRSDPGEPGRAKTPGRVAEDWRLLLQLDSDEHLGVMWGDAGSLYFWIREQDAIAGRFDKAWLILQCF